MSLKLLGNGPELFENLRHILAEFGYGPGGAHARHHVLALRVDQVFAVQLPLAGGRVAREGHAAARVFAHVAEDHCLDIDGGP